MQKFSTSNNFQLYIQHLFIEKRVLGTFLYITNKASFRHTSKECLYFTYIFMLWFFYLLKYICIYKDLVVVTEYKFYSVCFLITLLDQQKKHHYSYQLCWLTVNFFVFFPHPRFSFGHHPMLTISHKINCHWQFFEEKWPKWRDPFFRILICFYDFKTFLTPCKHFLKQYLDMKCQKMK